MLSIVVVWQSFWTALELQLPVKTGYVSILSLGVVYHYKSRLGGVDECISILNIGGVG